jgi:uncharacterized protein (TIGR02246 family)
MAAQHPQDLHKLFAEAFNGGDVEGLVKLYEPNALMASPERQTITGTEAIREMYQQFLATAGKMTIETIAAFESPEGLALLHGQWTLHDKSGAVAMSGRNTETARKQSDGTWLFLIDNPFTP